MAIECMGCKCNYCPKKNECSNCNCNHCEKGKGKVTTCTAYPECNNVCCPYHGCMGDNTCKLINVADYSVQYIKEHPGVLEYCKEPLKYIKD